jgi:hypothetical protein
MNGTGNPLAFGLCLILALCATTMANAKSPATNNVCWGKGAKHLAASGIMGQHSSAHGAFTPDPGESRLGVGTVSKQNHGDPEEPGGGLSQGAQGQHAVDVGAVLGSGASFLEGTAEGSIDTFECSSPGESDIVNIEPVG